MHRSLSIEKTKRQGLPVTMPSRTLLDLAEVVGPQELEQAIGEAERRRLATRATLTAYLSQAHGRRGVAAIRAVLDREGGPAFTRSGAERRLLALIRSAALPAPRVNTERGGYEVDFVWPREKLVVEVDGYEHHGSRRAFERDHRRDADLGPEFGQVLRFTWLQLEREPFFVVSRIAGELAARR